MNRITASNSQDLIVSGIHLDLTPSLKTYVHEKTARLFRHEMHILRMRVELECDNRQSVSSRFSAKGRIEINGPDLNAAVSADECHKAVALLVAKLDGLLRRRARLHKFKRNHPRAVEIGGIALPKTA
ncbi:HPF/RaiA family ribosome-associated protein [Termitidicoccus mucosus]|uniref:30S ribosomal protein S30 n=1 Tax=Termitidicoccus mucosus TaxID=1184151 RepID=A0A178IN05_9BACT|nr:30S ribosomal protein S30 [Opitutaceae bacterium TSB47]